MTRFFFSLLFIAVQIANAQNYGSLFRIVEEGRFGFIDAKGKVIIQPKFRYVGDFYSGLAAARLDSSYGFINQKGQFVIRPIYDFAEDFLDTTSVVILNNRRYFINRQGLTRAYSDDEYNRLKANYQQTYASCDTSKIIITKIENYGGFQIVNKNKRDTVFAYFNDVEDTYAEHNGVYQPDFGFRKELMLVVKNRRLCYVDTNGIIIWKSTSLQNNKPHKLNLDFRPAIGTNCMLIPDLMEKNDSNSYTSDIKELIIRVFPNEPVQFSDSLVGIKIRLISNLPYPDDTILIRDANVFWNLEIKNFEGKWIPFESRCAWRCITILREHDRDTIIKLPPKHYFTFVLPTYEGTHHAKFRYRFEGRIGIFYSQEFDGIYNPSQLYNEGVNYPESIIESVFGTMKLYQNHINNRVESNEGCIPMTKRMCFD